MSITIALSDMSQAGWQKLRKDVKEMESSGVGRALESYKALYAKGSKGVWAAGAPVWNEALKKGLEVTKALGVARQKAGTIKEANRKTLALDVVKGFEEAVAKFADGILTLEEAEKVKIANAKKQRETFAKTLTSDKVIADAVLLKTFYEFAKAEHATEAATAAVGWKQKKYKETTLKLAPDNDWNINGKDNKDLLEHYAGRTLLPSDKLKIVIDKVDTSFGEMVWGANASTLSRFKTSKTLDEYLQIKFRP